MTAKVSLRITGPIIAGGGDWLDSVVESYAYGAGSRSYVELKLTAEHRARLAQLFADGYSKIDAYQLLMAELSPHSRRLEGHRRQLAIRANHAKQRGQQKAAMRAYWKLAKERPSDRITVKHINGESGISTQKLYQWRFPKFLKKRVRRSVRFIF